MGDADKYKKKYLALKKQMEGGQKQIGGEESAMSSYTALIRNKVGTETFQDLLICPLVLTLNEINPLSSNSILIQKIKVPGQNTVEEGPAMFELTDTQMKGLAIKDVKQLKPPLLEKFIFHASLANVDLYRIIMNNMKNPFILKSRIEQFYNKHKVGNVSLDQMMEIMQHIVVDDNLMFKFILNSFNVVNLLSKDFLRINTDEDKLVYNLVLNLFSIQPFVVVNTNDKFVKTYSQFSRHANRLLHYFGPDNNKYRYDVEGKYHFVVYPSQNNIVADDVSFLVALNNTSNFQSKRRIKEENWPPVIVNLNGAKFEGDKFSYESLENPADKTTFNLFKEGQEVTVTFSFDLTDPTKTNTVSKGVQVKIRKEKDAQQFTIFNDDYVSLDSDNIDTTDIMTFIVDGE